MMSLERSLNTEEWVTGELRHVTEPQVQTPQFCFHHWDSFLKIHPHQAICSPDLWGA